MLDTGRKNSFPLHQSHNLANYTPQICSFCQTQVVFPFEADHWSGTAQANMVLSGGMSCTEELFNCTDLFFKVQTIPQRGTVPAELSGHSMRHMSNHQSSAFKWQNPQHYFPLKLKNEKTRRSHVARSDVQTPDVGQKFSKSKNPNKIEFFFTSDLHLPPNVPDRGGGPVGQIFSKSKNPNKIENFFTSDLHLPSNFPDGGSPISRKFSESKNPNKIEIIFNSDLHLPANFPARGGVPQDQKFSKRSGPPSKFANGVSLRVTRHRQTHTDNTSRLRATKKHTPSPHQRNCQTEQPKVKWHSRDVCCCSFWQPCSLVSLPKF